MAQRSLVPSAKGEFPHVNKNFREFEGLNTQAQRQAIKDTQWYQLENVMPIGFANAKAVPAPSTIKATLAATAYFRKDYNINGTEFMFYACSDGSAYQVNLSTFVKTTICAAGTFPAPGTQCAQWKNERLLIITSTNYYDWDGASLTAHGGTTGAPSGGTHIETYASSVWISSGRTMNYSQPASYTDFTGTGGNFIITDAVLTSSIQQVLAANNFLYIFGATSINVIADVNVNSAGTARIFSNTNISANSGTTLGQAIVPYYRAIWYMNTAGIYGLYGATPRKASDDLDGLFPLIDFTKPVTCGTVVIYNILCVAFMFTYADPVLGTRKAMIVYFGKKWFLATQGSALIGMATSHVTGADTMFADDGTNIYQLFSDTSSNISQTLKTALWDLGDFVKEKQALKVGVEIVVPNMVGTISVTVDTEQNSTAPSGAFSGQFAFTWTNSLGNAFTWTNSLSQAFTWLSSGYQWFFGDVQTQGHYLGVTVTSNTPQTIYSGIQLQYRTLPNGWWD